MKIEMRIKIKEKINSFKNKRIVKKYPFFLPYNVWTGELDKNYDYSYTYLDTIPTGWRKNALKCAKELVKLYKENGHLDYLKNKYRISQLKEKFGEMRWYDFGAPKEIYDEHLAIIRKYEGRSAFICCDCGRKAEYLSRGYILPFCDKCAGYPTNENEFTLIRR